MDASDPEFPADAAGASPPPRSARPPTKIWYGADLLLVGLVVVLAVAAFVRARGQLRQQQARDRVSQDLTAAVAAFQAHFRQAGSAPADAAGGVVPQGMAPFLTGLDWTVPTPAGGHYRWINTTYVAPMAAPASAAPIETPATAAPLDAPASSPPVATPAAATPLVAAPPGGVIAITAFPPSPAFTFSLADLREIDRRLDDGDLATGKFRLGFNGWPVLTVRAQP